MHMNGWCPAWPQEVKDAERRLYRANCKLRCLENALDRTDPADFDTLWEQIDAAREELRAAAFERTKLGYF